MNLLLFETLRGDTHPIGERDSGDDHPVSAGPGTFGRLKGHIQTTYRVLANKIDYHERLCSHLRHSSGLHVFHSPGVDSTEARKTLRRFMRSCIKKHTRWAWIDGIIAIAGIILAPLPGPNIAFFYPAARSLGHYFARTGARRILALKTLHFQVEPLIDEVQIHLKRNPGEATAALLELKQRYYLDDLDLLLKPLTQDARE